MESTQCSYDDLTRSRAWLLLDGHANLKTVVSQRETVNSDCKTVVQQLYEFLKLLKVILQH